MAEQASLDLIVEVEGGFSTGSGAFTVKDLREVLNRLPDDLVLKIRFPSRDFSSETMSALGWIGEEVDPPLGWELAGEDEKPPRSVFLQPLAPSRVKANRDFYASSKSKTRET